MRIGYNSSGSRAAIAKTVRERVWSSRTYKRPSSNFNKNTKGTGISNTSNSSVQKNNHSYSNSSLLEALKKAMEKTNEEKEDAKTDKGDNKSSTILSELLSSYTIMNTSAEKVRDHAKVLTNAKSDSLFEKAKDYKNNSAVISEIKDFVADYNQMVDKMKTFGGNNNDRYLKQLSNYANTYKTALSEVGLTMDSDSKLVIDDKKLTKAEYSKLKAAFGRNNSFINMAATKATTIAANAADKIVKLNSTIKNSNNIKAWKTRYSAKA